MSILRFLAMISAGKFRQNQANDESKKSMKTTQAETIGQLTNETKNYSSECPNDETLARKIIQAEKYGKITNETECESSK